MVCVTVNNEISKQEIFVSPALNLCVIIKVLEEKYMLYSEFVKENYDTLLDIVNCMQVGVWITDRNARLIMVNDKSLTRGGLSREEVMGRHMSELIECGYILYESSVLKALKSGKEESLIQEIGEGGFLLAISVPLRYEGEIDLVVCIERNITEVLQLRNRLDNQKNIAERYKSELIQIKNEMMESDDEIITQNTHMLKIKETIKGIGDMDVNIIISGESGTGKEVVANFIQKNSKRADKPFIKVNCAAIPESLMESEFFGYEKGAFTSANEKGKVGLLELADGGTLFLDEIGELPLHMQSKLLRVIQDMELRRVGGTETIKVNFRLIVATNKNLKEEIEDGRFREDLYYRLFVLPIELPPLRSRKEDIEPLSQHFVNESNKAYGKKKVLTEEAIDELKQYDWPGNVRELRNIIERLVVSGAGNEISSFQVTNCMRNAVADSFVGTSAGSAFRVEGASLAQSMAEYERQLIVECFRACKTVSETARQLQVNKSTISRRLKEYGVDVK